MKNLSEQIELLRKDFPILGEKVYQRPLVYLDNAATTQKPQCVLTAISDFYQHHNANVHRGVHYLSQYATDLLETARQKVAQFVHATDTHEIVFTRGATESLNLIASSYADAFLQEGDEILVSEMEHHSNIVPWQLQAERKGFNIKVIPFNEEGRLNLEAYEQLLTARTKLVAVTQVSNVLGTVNPIAQMAEMAHAHQAHILVDGAQSVPHLPVDVQALGVDFLVASGHKIYAPTGIGFLYGKSELLEQMPPYQGGGEMISRVSWEKTTYERLPYKFEAGTPNYVGAHALGIALDYVRQVGWDLIQTQEHALTRYAMEKLSEIDGLHLYGTTPHKEAVVAFNVGDIHHLDLGTLLDRLGIAIRTGHHCAQPLMQHYGVEGMCRASFAFYNTMEEVDALVAGLQRVVKMF